MSDNIVDMNYYLSVEYIRKELIEKMRKKGISEKEIKQFISICDKAYKENGEPYPTLEE